MAQLPEGAVPINTDIPIVPQQAPVASNLPQGAAPVPTWLTVPQKAPAAPPPTLMGDIRQRIEGRQSEMATTFEDIAAGTIKPSNAVTQIIGKGVAGPVADVAGALMSSGMRKVGDFAVRVAPGASAYLADGLKWLEESVPAQEALLYARNGAEAYAGWKQNNPQDARTLESIVNIGAVLNPGKPSTTTFAGRAAAVLEKSAVEGRKEFVTKLVLPVRTKKVRMDEVGRTTQQGVFLRNVPTPSGMEKDAIDEVSKLTGVTGSRSAQYNYNVIREANIKKAEDLMKALDAANIPVDPALLAQRMDADIQNLISNSAVITGNVAVVANKVKGYASSLFASSNGTAADLLRTRQQFDKWVKLQKGDAAFDEERLNALNLSVRQVRSTLNDYLDSVAPNQSVKESLRSQHRLYYAMDNVQEKAAEEAATVVGRLYQNIHKATGGSLPTTPLALAATGAVGLGAIQAGWLPYAVAPLMYVPIGMAAYKGATSPMMRQQLATLFKGIDTAMKKAGTPQLKVELAKDRLALMEILKDLPAEKPEEEQK